MEEAREGRILTSIPGIGIVHAATLLAAIGHIDNFPTAAALKSYLSWAPAVAQTGTTLDSVRRGRGGTRPAKKALFLIVANAIQLDSEWKRLYERLVPKKCSYDERTREYKGKKKVIGRIAGQMISLIYGLLKRDQEVVQNTAPGHTPPNSELYDAVKHKTHRKVSIVHSNRVQSQVMWSISLLAIPRRMP